MPTQRAAAAQRPIYNAQREERSRRAARNDDAARRRRRPERQYTDYARENDNTPQGYATTSERYRAAAAARTQRANSYEALAARAAPDEQMVFDQQTGRSVRGAAGTGAAAQSGARRSRRRRRSVITDTTSTQTRTAPRTVKAAALNRLRLAGTRALTRSLQGPLWLYYSVQLLLGLVGLVFFLIAGAESAVSGAGSSFIGGVASGIANAIPGLNVINLFYSETISTVLSPTTLAMAFLFLLFILNLFVLIILLLIFGFVGQVLPNPDGGPAIRPIFGREGTVIKFFSFITILVTSTLPLLNLLPALQVWTFVVGRFPR